MQIELTFSNDPAHLSGVHACLHATLTQLLFQESDIEQLGDFIEAAVKNAMEHAYPDGEEGLIKLSIQESHGKLEIQVRDYGIPKDVESMERKLLDAQQTSAKVFGHALTEVADRVHWLSFGPNGKALEVVKWLHSSNVVEANETGNDASTSEPPKPTQVPRAPEQPYDIRRMRADEAEQVSQLIYQTYGNSYFNEDVYYPDRVAAQNEHGIVISYVAVTEDGSVVGHYALEREQAGPVAEVGQAVVSPAHRGRGLLDRMKNLALAEAEKTDLMGWYADAVTVHTVTQKSNVAHGGQLSAVQLAISPKTEHFNSKGEQPQRVTCLMYFHWLKSPEKRMVYVPSRHEPIVGKIYERLRCPVEFQRGHAPTGHGTLEVKINANAGRAVLTVGEIGTDTVSMLSHARRELVERKHAEVVFVDLPISHPATAGVAEELESSGFGFVGIAPHFSTAGDLLRLAYLVEPLDREPIHTLDEVAGEMVDYALEEQRRLQKTLS